jgi:co-chaperonin GroES (HSP10)
MIIVTGCRILVKPLTFADFDPTAKKLKELGFETAPDKRQEKINMDRGVVLQIGPKCDEVYVGDLKKGDIIGFTKFGGKFFQDEKTKEELLIINDEDVICIFKED